MVFLCLHQQEDNAVVIGDVATVCVSRYRCGLMPKPFIFPA